MKFLFPIYFLFTSLLASAVSPQVSNISYSQRIDQNGSRTKLVDIQYDLDGNRSMYVEFFFSHDGGLSFPIICTAVSGDGGSGIQAGTSKNAAKDKNMKKTIFILWKFNCCYMCLDIYGRFIPLQDFPTHPYPGMSLRRYRHCHH